MYTMIAPHISYMVAAVLSPVCIAASAPATAGPAAPKKAPVNDPVYVKSLISLLQFAKSLHRDAFSDNVELGRGLLVSTVMSNILASSYYLLSSNPTSTTTACHGAATTPNGFTCAVSAICIGMHAAYGSTAWT